MELFRKDPKTRIKALKLYQRTEKSFEEDVTTIKKWLKSQPHLPEQMDDARIRNFLLLNKCSIENTKQKIDMYYTIRSIMPDFFENTNPNFECMRDFRKTKSCMVLHPVLFENMYRVFFIKGRKPDKIDAHSQLMQIFNVEELRLGQDSMLGDIFICDMTNANLESILGYTPSLLAKASAMYKNVYSFRVKSVHIINSKPYMEKCLSILKMLIKPKIFERFHLHKDAEILKEMFPKDQLPKDYGGDGPSLNEMNDLLEAQFEEHKERFNKLDKLRVDESLRPKKLDNDHILGFHGNFKKLDVD